MEPYYTHNTHNYRNKSSGRIHHNTLTGIPPSSSLGDQKIQAIYSSHRVRYKFSFQLGPNTHYKKLQVMVRCNICRSLNRLFHPCPFRTCLSAFSSFASWDLLSSHSSSGGTSSYGWPHIHPQQSIILHLSVSFLL